MRITALLFISLLAGPAFAQDKPANSALPVPTPAAELERLKPLAGNWVCKGQVPGSPVRTYTSEFTIEPIRDGFAYTVAYDQKEAKPPYSGAWTVAWDGGQKKLVFFWLDNVGNVGVETAGDWSGDKFVAEGVGFVPPGFVPVALAGTAGFRDTFTRKSDGGMHWTGELKLHGANSWTIIGEDDCIKK